MKHGERCVREGMLNVLRQLWDILLASIHRCCYTNVLCVLACVRICHWMLQQTCALHWLMLSINEIMMAPNLLLDTIIYFTTILLLLRSRLSCTRATLVKHGRQIFVQLISEVSVDVVVHCKRYKIHTKHRIDVCKSGKCISHFALKWFLRIEIRRICVCVCVKHWFLFQAVSWSDRNSI